MDTDTGFPVKQSQTSPQEASKRSWRNTQNHRNNHRKPNNRDRRSRFSYQWD